MRYVRKPIEVEAHLWNGYDGVYEIVEEMVHPAPVERQGNDALAIHTMRGTKTARIGDMVCKGDEGNVFVMPAATFTNLYYEIEEEDVL